MDVPYRYFGALVHGREVAREGLHELLKAVESLARAERRGGWSQIKALPRQGGAPVVIGAVEWTKAGEVDPRGFEPAEDADLVEGMEDAA